MFNPKELAREACRIGTEKVNRGFTKVFVSGILAGAFIGLGYYGYLVLASTIPQMGRFYGALFFAIGLVMIIIAGGDLFTGNCLLTMGWMNRDYPFIKVLKNWGIVFLGNFLGALFLGSLLYFASLPFNYRSEIIAVAEGKLNLKFFEAFFRGILCNVLVGLAVYMSYAAKSIPGKILTVMLPVALFVICGYEHSVANMFVLPLGQALGGEGNFLDILFKNLLPVTLGNLVGGAILIPGAYYLLFLHER
ncbi:MAG: formate/nitrite transporter family protein [Acholeplasmataceae bacterium]|nr:formate/nitrite transporter family protein [Acholeplasmataceae bacterium]